MKKLFGLILTALLLFSGCAQQAAAQGAQPANSQNNAQQATSSQLSQNQTRIYGKIQEINGNEIVLEVGTMNMPSGASGDMSPGFSGNIRPGSSGKNGADGGWAPPDNQSPDAGAQGGQSNTASGTTGKGSRGAGMQGGAGAGGFGGSVNLDYSGETKTLMIPVGLKITSGRGANAKEADFTTLAKDNVIMAVLEKGGNGSETVVSIKLLS